MTILGSLENSSHQMADRIAYIFLIAALVFTTLGYGGVHQPIISIYYLLVIGAGISLAVYSMRTSATVPSREMLQIPLLGAAAYAFLQLVPFGAVASVAGVGEIPRTISIDQFSTWSSALQFTAASIFFAGMLVCLNSAKRIRWLFVFLVIFGFGYSFFAVLQSVLSPTKIYGIYEIAAGAPFGSFVNRNSFAGFLIMILALPLGMFFAGRFSKDQLLLLLTAVVLMGSALLLCDSRGGFVAFISELILIVFLTRNGRSRRDVVIRGILVLMLVAAIAAGAAFVGGDTSFNRFIETASSDDFSTSRSQIWLTTLSVINAHLPFGAGFGAFGVAYTPFDVTSGMFRVEQAHNDYLQVLADAGIPGLLLGILFLYRFVVLGVRSLKIENAFRRGIAVGAFAGGFGVLVHSLFDFPLHVTAVSLLFLTLLALLSASQNMYADDSDDDPKPKHRRKRKTVDRELSSPSGEAMLHRQQ